MSLMRCKSVLIAIRLLLSLCFRMSSLLVTLCIVYILDMSPRVKGHARDYSAGHTRGQGIDDPASVPFIQSRVEVGETMVEVMPLRIQHLLGMQRFLVGFNHCRLGPRP